jgi:hypothetical protein
MEKLRRTRIKIRIVVMVFAAFLLATVPQLLIKRPVLAAFYLDNASQNIAMEYQKSLYWAHFGGVLALLAANLIFFIVHEKKGYTGKALHKRLSLQNWINFLLICAGVGAMVGMRYGVVSDPLIGNYISQNIYIIIRSVLPYIVLIFCGAIIWTLCMRYVPATNVPLRGWLAVYWDDKLKAIKN